MHEWALAEGVVGSVLRAAGGRRVAAVRLRLGELQQIDVEVLRFAIGELSRGTAAEGMEVEVQTEPAEFECTSCGNRWNPLGTKIDGDIMELIHFLPESSKIHMRCPRCGSSDFRISGGRGLWIESILIRE